MVQTKEATGRRGDYQSPVILEHATILRKMRCFLLQNFSLHKDSSQAQNDVQQHLTPFPSPS